MSDEIHQCQCEGPGYCPRWGREVSQTGHRICRRGNERSIAAYFGTGEKRDERRPVPFDPSHPCAYLGGPVMEGDRQVTRSCQTCRGRKSVKVYACNHPAHAANPTTTERDCKSCRDWSTELVQLEPVKPVAEVNVWRGGAAEGPKVEPPSLLRKAANFAGALAGHAAAGFPQAPPEVLTERLATCQTCEHLDGRACRVCGCFVGEKAKWAEQECPVGKWPKVDPVTEEPHASR